jgi:hypothetical protein
MRHPVHAAGEIFEVQAQQVSLDEPETLVGERSGEIAPLREISSRVVD